MRQLKIAKQITDRTSLSLDKYLHEISKIDLIKSEEEVQLAKRIRNGDKLALEKLIKANLRFVVSVAKQYQNQGLSLPDLINEGNLGLIKAAQLYNETRGFKFISYGVWWIRQSILLAVADQARIVRLPLNQIANITRINKKINTLQQEYQREPTANEVAASLQISPALVEESLKISSHQISTDAPTHNEEEGNFFDVYLNEDSISPDKFLMKDSLREDIELALCHLPAYEAKVIRLFFGLNNNQKLSLEEIGSEFSLSRERIRQIKDKAIKKMRINSRNKILRAYL